MNPASEIESHTTNGLWWLDVQVSFRKQDRFDLPANKVCSFYDFFIAWIQVDDFIGKNRNKNASVEEVEQVHDLLELFFIDLDGRSPINNLHIDSQAGEQTQPVHSYATWRVACRVSCRTKHILSLL